MHHSLDMSKSVLEQASENIINLIGGFELQFDDICKLITRKLLSKASMFNVYMYEGYSCM